MAKPPKKTSPSFDDLNIGAVVRLSAVSEFTLRAWERRYQAIQPQRTETGRRRYTHEDVNRVRLLARLVQEGHSIGRIARLPQEALEKLLSQLPPSNEEKEHDEPAPHFDGELPDAHADLSAILQALGEFRLDLLSQELQRVRLSYGARAFVHAIAAPLLSEVGTHVEKRTLTIAQEHALSELIRDQLGRLYRPYESPRTEDHPGLLFAAPERDFHDFAILISAILASIHGFSTHFLGPNLPPESIRESTQRTSSKIVVLGLAPLPPEERPRPLLEFLTELDELLPVDVALWLGGRGVEQLPKKFEQKLKSRGKREIMTLESLADFEEALRSL